MKPEPELSFQLLFFKIYCKGTQGVRLGFILALLVIAVAFVSRWL